MSITVSEKRFELGFFRMYGIYGANTPMNTSQAKMVFAKKTEKNIDSFTIEIVPPASNAFIL